MYIFLPHHHGFKKSKKGKWFYRRVRLVPQFFPILKKKEEKGYYITNELLKELMTNCGVEGIKWFFIFLIPGLFLGLFYKKAFFTLVILGFYLVNKEINKNHENIEAKLKSLNLKKEEVKNV